MNRRFLLTASVATLASAVSSIPARAGEAGFDIAGQVALNAYRGLVEEHLFGVRTSLKAAALSIQAQSGRWDEVKPLLREIAGAIPTEAAVWYALPDGHYYTVDGGLSKQTLSDRDYFPGLMAGRAVLGALVISKSTGHRSIIIAVPVTVGGRVVAALGVSDDARLVSDMVIAQTAMPDDLIFYALDGKGQAAIHRDPDKMFLFPSDLGNPSLKSAVNEIMTRETGSVRYEMGGVGRIALFTASRISGWRFVLARAGG